MKKLEDYNTEYKQSWNDNCMKTLCAFANKHGGTLYLGIDDDGNTKGVKEVKELLRNIPNEVENALGFIPDVKLKKNKAGDYVTISVKPQSSAISFREKFYVRSGSSSKELKGVQLQKFLLEKNGDSWESIIENRATLKDIDEKTIRHFKELASKRLSIASREKSTSVLLEKLGLYKKGKLTRAAVLLFAKEPQKFYKRSTINIGRFKDEATVQGMDEITGNLFRQVEETMDILKKKYLVSEVTFEGLKRVEELEYPEGALREAIVNAVVHRDYSSIHSQIRVYPDQLSIWNNGELVGLSIEDLKKKHSSYPRNELIADVFHKAGYIERWGTGTVKMVNDCKLFGLPEPIYEETQGGMQVTFLKDVYTEEYFKKANLNERQIKAMLHVKRYGSISNKEYQNITGAIKRTATRDLAELLKKKLLIKKGVTGKGTAYSLWGHKGDKGDTNGTLRRHNELDKKLALLEKDLKTIDPSETSQAYFNKSEFFKIYDSWLSDLMRVLVPVAQKFNKFFKENNHHIFVISGIGKVDFKGENIEKIIRALKADCKKHENSIGNKADFEFHFSYRRLASGGLKEFGLTQTVKIEFNEIKYRVLMDEFSGENASNSVEQISDRLLHKPMTKKEMNDLANKLGNVLYDKIDYYSKQRGIRK